MQDEERAELCAAFLSCLMQGSEVPAVGGIHKAVVLDQHSCHINMLKKKVAQDGLETNSCNKAYFTHSKRRCIVKRDEASFVFGIYISSLLQQILHHIQMIVPS